MWRSGSPPRAARHGYAAARRCGACFCALAARRRVPRAAPQLSASRYSTTPLLSGLLKLQPALALRINTLLKLV
jgi:hypothetical protein